MNKHGFKGVRMRTDGRAMPFYARATVKGEYIYLPSRKTAEDAAKDFETFRRTSPLFRIYEEGMAKDDQ